MALPASVDKVVVLGDSIQQTAFGQSLTTPSDYATKIFEWLGVTGVPVYGFAQSGDKVSDCIIKAQQAFDEFGTTALYIVQIGTNDIHNGYTGFSQALSDEYQTLCDIFVGGGAEFILGTIPFKGDGVSGATSQETRDIYESDTNWAKPWNESVVLPIIAANVNPDYLMNNGVPVTDLYEQVRKHYYQILDDDTTHLSTDCAYLILRRIAYLFTNGTKPTPTDDSLPLKRFVLNFVGDTTPLSVPRTSLAYNEDVNNSLLSPIQIENGVGAMAELSVDTNGSTITQSVGLARSDFYTDGFLYETLACYQLASRGFYLDANSTTLSLRFSNLKPSTEYTFSFFGNRSSTASNRQSAEWNGNSTGLFEAFIVSDSGNPIPQEPELLTVSDANGELQVDIVPDNRTVYLSAISLEEVAPPLPTVNAGPNLTTTNGDTVTLSGATASNYDSLLWTCTSGQSPTFSDATALNPTVTFNEVGVHTLQLAATNAEGTTTSTLTATVEAAGNGPIADAGQNQSVASGATVQLDGTGSSIGGTYEWVQVSGPTVKLINADSAKAKIIAPQVTQDEQVVMGLTVTVGGIASAQATVTINIASWKGGFVSSTATVARG